MFFVTSKVLSGLLQSGTWLLVLQAVGLWLLWRRRYRHVGWVFGITFAITFMLYFSPMGPILIRTLEEFSRPPELPAHVDGVVALSGVVDAVLTEAYGTPHLGGDAARITELAAIARRYPAAKLVYAGGSGQLIRKGMSEAQVVRRILADQGIDPSRVTFEADSRNTYESAVMARDLVQPKPGENWLLITSANHMPRAHGVFRKAGWDVIPYPVSYRALPAFSIYERSQAAFDIAIREWVGIAVYRLTGRM